MRGRLVLHFIDQDAARYNLVRGYAASDSAAAIVDAFWQAEAALGAGSWFARVQTDANLGDPASRDGEGAARDAWCDRDVVDESELRRALGV